MTLLLQDIESPPILAHGVVALLFAADEPLEISRLATLLESSRREVEQAIDDLLLAPIAGLIVQRHGDSLQLATAPEWSGAVTRLREGPPVKLSRPALEVLAIVAYRQPVTRADVDHLRGVNSDRAVASLLAHELIEEVGRRETVGRPTLFAVTGQFLELVGIQSLSDLPSLLELAAQDAGDEEPDTVVAGAGDNADLS